MTVEITTSGFRSPRVNKRDLLINMIGIPVSGTEVMYALVGMVDAERPNFHSAEFSVTSSFSQPMELVAQNVGAGGEPFPAAFIVALKNPAATSGTIRVEFDDNVAVMNGMGLVFSGLNTGSSFIPHTGPAVHTQRPDFLVEDGTMVVPSGQLVLDICMAQSSNHTGHLVPSGSLPTKIEEASVSMHKFSAAFQVTESGGPVLLQREECGGPFAGVTLTAVSIDVV